MSDVVSQFHIDLLTACEEDWESAAGVYSLALSAGLDDPVATRALAIGLTVDALHAGWLVAGDLTAEGFVPWTGDSRDHANRVAQAWLETDDVIVGVGDVAWFDITEEGSECLARRGSP
ncbi:hypothetical protein [Janibacter indicus]|uniref:hypothetical protein n=1 Tax=Janibacter indicus TaxID=857417 RepID=UPI003EBC5F50